jgi:acetylornithine deacetylase/succinyl-diaminopimelate desuccinylase-like protein
VSSCEPDHYPELPGFDHGTVPFGSDAPRLRNLARDRMVVLAGPGSITLAHSEEERITGAELQDGAALLVRIAEALRARADQAGGR